MNCYYSNLIEGHDTHPVDIERALKGDYSPDAQKRDLQLEAKAHIAVQQWIDRGGLKALPSADNPRNSPPVLRTASRRPLWVEDPETKEKSGSSPASCAIATWRSAATFPSVRRRPALPQALRKVYSKLGKTETILAAAAAHHRLAGFIRFSTATAASRA